MAARGVGDLGGQLRNMDGHVNSTIFKWITNKVLCIWRTPAQC